MISCFLNDWKTHKNQTFLKQKSIVEQRQKLSYVKKLNFQWKNKEQTARVKKKRETINISLIDKVIIWKFQLIMENRRFLPIKFAHTQTWYRFLIYFRDCFLFLQMIMSTFFLRDYLRWAFKNEWAEIRLPANFVDFLIRNVGKAYIEHF